RDRGVAPAGPDAGPATSGVGAVRPFRETRQGADEVTRRSAAMLLLAVLAVPVVALLAQAGGDGPVLSEITEPRLEADIRFLSHDLLEGRAPSTRGGELAAQYIAARFAGIGLQPGAPDGTFFQPVTIVESRVSPDFTLSISGAGAPLRLEYLKDVV